MNPSILSYLKCVDCENEHLNLFKIEVNFSNDVKMGKILCDGCGSIFPIYNFIPIIISNKIIKLFLSEGALTFCKEAGIKFKNNQSIDISIKVLQDSSSNWGFQWEKCCGQFNNQDNYFLSEEAFLNFIPISKEEYREKDVLVAGAGFGREIGHIARYFCKNIFAIDISSSIYIARENCSSFSNIHFVMTDIMNLPFSSKFDIVLSDHVLQHLPNVEKGVNGLLGSAKKGGIFSCNFYSWENNFIMHSIIEPIKKILFLLFSLRFIYYLSIIPALGCFLTIKFYKLLNNLIPSLAKKLPLNDHFNFWSGLPFIWLWRAVIFDLLQAPLARYFSRDDVEKLFNKYKHLQIKSHAGTLWCVKVVI